MRVKQMGGPTKEQKAMMKQMAEGGGMGGGNPMDQFMIPPDQMVNLPPTPNRKAQIFWPMRKLLVFLLYYVLLCVALLCCYCALPSLFVKKHIVVHIVRSSLVFVYRCLSFPPTSIFASSTKRELSKR
jgi:hypothetical protein